MNEKLINLGLSEIDVELLEKHDVKINEIQNEMLPSAFNYVIKELNNLENIINDGAYLEKMFVFSAFESSIYYSQEIGFYVNANFKKIPVVKRNPKLIGNFTFNSYEWDSETDLRHYYFQRRMEKFTDYIFNFKKQYLKNIERCSEIAQVIEYIVENE